MPARRFPREFVLGVATSSYQIEGAHDEDGRLPSIWDTFCRTPGKVVRQENGDVACDHYHRYREDVALMKSLGMHAYRFSVAWPRVLPTGFEDAPNEAGLDFYDRLVDELLAAGITPWVTLYHWDLPQPLEDMGGWPDRRIVDHFVRYADIVSRRLGDRVGHWITHNEPWCAAMLGYMTGEHAPGHKDWPAALAAVHHILLSHGRAVPVIRENVGAHAKVGITLNLTPGVPASPSAADAEATRHFDGFFNRWFLDPCYGRPYPSDMVADYRRMGRLPEGPIPFLREGDIAEMGAKTDFLGINFYSRAILRSEEVSEEDNAPRTIPVPGPDQQTDMGWEVVPDALRGLLVRVGEEYPVGALVITENGAAWPEGPDADGRVRDERRRQYLHDHLAACLDAIDEGAPLTGYFAWSFMDNFEWAFGYEKRFGIVHVDYDTLVRTPKDSALWYRTVAESGVLQPVDVAEPGAAVAAAAEESGAE